MTITMWDIKSWHCHTELLHKKPHWERLITRNNVANVTVRITRNMVAIVTYKVTITRHSHSYDSIVRYKVIIMTVTLWIMTKSHCEILIIRNKVAIVTVTITRNIFAIVIYTKVTITRVTLWDLKSQLWLLHYEILSNNSETLNWLKKSYCEILSHSCYKVTVWDIKLHCKI